MFLDPVFIDYTPFVFDVKYSKSDIDYLNKIAKELVDFANNPEIKLMMHERGYKVKWEIACSERYLPVPKGD